MKYERLKNNLGILKEHNKTNRPVYHITNGKTFEIDLINEIISDSKDLFDKIENGTLIELPCKVGDKVYEVFYSEYEARILEMKVEQITIQNTINYWCRTTSLCLYNYGLIKNEYFGKTVFLTKAEAEAKLKELKEV